MNQILAQIGGGEFIAEILRPIAIAVAFAIALWALQRFGGEPLPKIVAYIFKEVRQLIQGERSTLALNALILILAFLLIIVLMDSPIKEIFMGTSNEEGEGERLIMAGLSGFLIISFFGAGLISMKISQYENPP